MGRKPRRCSVGQWRGLLSPRRDLEGVIVKRADGAYGQDWFKIRNPRYTQYEGRRELFEKRKGRVTLINGKAADKEAAVRFR